jgi:adenylate cyclase
MDRGKGCSEYSQFDKRRIAVLPFANISPDPTDEYFADGLTEETIASLSWLPELQIIARTSVMNYKSGSKHVSTIGQDLRVGSVLEGSVRKSGKKIRVTVQLIDVATEAHVWSNNYNRELNDVFAIQSDVAGKVVEALEIRLLSFEKKRLEKAPTSNISAYTLYLKGRFYYNRIDGEGARRAIGYFEQAIEEDPGFALAYADLAFSYTQLAFFGMLSPQEAGMKARMYVEKALKLDDSLAEAHLVMGQILRNHDWDFVGAAREFKRAVELTPSLAEAHGRFAILMAFNRDFEEAISEARRTLELDPLSSQASQFAGTVFLYAGRYDDAIAQFTKALEIDPGTAYARGNLGLAYIQRDMFDIGFAELQRVATVKAPLTTSDLAYAYAKAGRFEDLRKLLNELLKEVENNDELAVALASAYANLGERDSAFVWLQKAFEEHLPSLITANGDFVFDCIRSDPRFQELMKKVGWTNS